MRGRYKSRKIGICITTSEAGSSFSTKNSCGEDQKIMNTPSFLGDLAVTSFVLNYALSLLHLPHAPQLCPEQIKTAEHPSPRAAVWEKMS